MKLGIISPHDNTEYLAEFTDFDVCLGYMAMRYPRYLEIMQSLRFMKRDMILMQMPDHIIRGDFYLTTVRRVEPQTVVTPHAPGQDAQTQFDYFMEYLDIVNRNAEILKFEVAPYITLADDERNLTRYEEITKNWFVQWDAAQKLSTKFIHHSTVVGTPDIGVLRKKKPVALITAMPIMLAQLGTTINTETVTTMASRNFSPDWFLRPLTDEQLKLAVENIKELRNVVTNPEKRLDS